MISKNKLSAKSPKCKTIVFDSGPIISLTTSNMLYILGKLKKKYNLKFLITPSVKHELIENALATKRFELEALLVMSEIKKNTIQITKQSEELKQKTNELLAIANSIIKINNRPISLVHRAEVEIVAYAILNGINLLCIDERSMRLLIEDAKSLVKIISKRLHKPAKIDTLQLNIFKELTKDLKIIRSSEIAFKAFENKIININIDYSKKEILSAILWSIKLHGCTISSDEINEAKALVK